jgi:hypothetical protein
MARRRKKAAEVAAVEDVTATAARIAAMLDRWEAEDVSDEPDWDIEDIESLALPRAQRARQETSTGM